MSSILQPGWKLVRDEDGTRSVEAVATPISDAALSRFPEFVEALEKRMRAGRAVYGDSSFEKSAVQLLEEMRQEAADISGWGGILYLKLAPADEELRQRVMTIASWGANIYLQLTELIEAQGRMLGRDQ